MLTETVPKMLPVLQGYSCGCFVNFLWVCRTRQGKADDAELLSKFAAGVNTSQTESWRNGLSDIYRMREGTQWKTVLCSGKLQAVGNVMIEL